MARKQEFDEMTLITEESTINEHQNVAKKEEYLQQLHRQINGSAQGDSEFQFYPGKTSNTNKSGRQGAEMAYPTADVGVSQKQDSVMTVTIEGTQNERPIQGQDSVMEPLDASQSRFGGSLIDESFAGAARGSHAVDSTAQAPIEQPSQVGNSTSLPVRTSQEVDFKSRALPIDSSEMMSQGSAMNQLGNTAKVIKPQLNFLRNDDQQFSPVVRTDGLPTQNTPQQQRQQVAPYDEEEDIIEQTFGVGDDRNTQIFQDLPTPKSRMKREIDIENEFSSAVASHAQDRMQAGSGAKGSATQNTRKKIQDVGKRISEHQVAELGLDDSSDAPKTLHKKQLYAASQQVIETTANANVKPTKQHIDLGFDDKPVAPEQPVEVNNLASYFEKMQVGKKSSAPGQGSVNTSTTPVKASRVAQGATQNVGGLSSDQKKLVQGVQMAKGDSVDPTTSQGIASGQVSQGMGSVQARNRALSSEKGSVNQGNNLASKQQQLKGDERGSPLRKQKEQKQGPRTGSPIKLENLLISKQRGALDRGMQNSSTPTIKDPSKNFALKTKLEEALKPSAENPKPRLDDSKGEIDETTKKMIIGYQQLKRRKHATSGDTGLAKDQDEPRMQTANERKRSKVGQDSDKRELSSVQSNAAGQTGQKARDQLSNQEDHQPPRGAQFSVAIVGYQDKRQKSELEQELEASLRENQVSKKANNLTEAYNTKHSASKANNRQNRTNQLYDLEISEDRYLGVASDFEGNLTQDMQTSTLRTRKLYSQQKRGTRKQILASALKKNKEFKEKINTIEHVGVVSKGLDSNFKIEGRRFMDQIEIDNQSGGTQGNVLNNLDELGDGFNGSNFDMQSMQGNSQNQYAGGPSMHFVANMGANTHSHAFGAAAGRVLSQADSNQQKRLSQMQQYQMIKGAKQGKHGYLEPASWDNRPLSHGQNQFAAPGEVAGAPDANGVPTPLMLNSIDAMRDEYLHELPKSINIHSNQGSGKLLPRPIGHGALQEAELTGAEKVQVHHHDVSFKIDKRRKPIPPGKPRLETLPASALVVICKYLKPADTLKLGMTRKVVQQTQEKSEFDSLWVLFSFQTIFSKTGRLGIRNASQRRIDDALNAMHFQCESIRRDSKEVQVGIFEKWLLAFLACTMLGVPALLVASHDAEKGLNVQMILAPLTAAWGLLILAQGYAWYRIRKYYRRVKSLHLTQPQFKLEPGFQGSPPSKMNPNVRLTPSTAFPVTKEFFQKPVRGRNAKHCSLYSFGEFVNRFAMMNMFGLTCLYLGFFLKVYVLDDSITYFMLAPISIGPLILMYLYEMCTEVAKDTSNFSRKAAHFSSQMAKEDEMVGLRSHKYLRRKINFGLIPNFLLFTGYHGGFFCLICLRLDREIETSFFVLLIPLWILLLYFSAFLVVSGLASTNQRVNKCEKVTLSLLVPIGFILSLCLALALADGLVSFPFYMCLIPLVSSLIFGYLYVRCLVKPSKADFVKVKPEQAGQAPSSADQSAQQPIRFQNPNSMQIVQQLAQQMQHIQQQQQQQQQSNFGSAAKASAAGGASGFAPMAQPQVQVGQGSATVTNASTGKGVAPSKPPLGSSAQRQSKDASQQQPIFMHGSKVRPHDAS